ncbi:DUF2156 domain-containing protein [Cryobacterium sp. PH29-G1]|uniref:DUF2156 domain-containing protein n=1 Tax=Cryobacterium sp. PH29-G1 TaxID=3046211 RepID=UPI0024B9F4A2|nr:DUF2156 domain-containing protein [Cryobacterium sp. PH29-G1]MDJ0348454.1 DUF2156 domain-containing protein [Cryobacterium sp. PH29-G1]
MTGNRAAHEKGPDIEPVSGSTADGPDPTPAPRHSARRTLYRLAAQRPWAVAYAVILLGVALVSGVVSGPSHDIRLLFGTGFASVIDRGHWWSPLTSVFFVDNGAELLLALAGTVIVLGFAERLMGTRRTAIAFLTTAVLGAAIGLGVQYLGVASGEMWSRGVSELWAIDPFTPIFGTAMAASYFAGPLWRRRIRVLGLSTVLVLVLYSGQPSDLYRLLAVLVGLGLGWLFRPTLRVTSWRRSSDHETRTLVAAIVGMVAVGPVVTIFSGARFGLLAPLGLLLTQDVPTAGEVVDRCLLGDVTRQCVQELTLERIGGAGPVLVSLLPLLTLVVAIFGLARGRRFAAWLAITINTGLALLAGWYYGLLPISGQAYVLQWPNGRYWEIAVVLVVSVLVPLIVALVILANLRHFPVPSRPGQRRRFLLVTGGSFTALAAFYIGVGWMLRGHFQPAVTVLDLLADVPERFIPVGFLRLERVSFLPTDPISTALYDGVGAAFWIVVFVGAIVCLGSTSLGSTADAPGRLRTLLSAHGGGSLGFMTTWTGNSLWFTANGHSAVAYRVVRGIAITTSEPVGPPAEGADAVASFARMCDDHGWVPVFYSVHENWRPAFTAMGWHTTQVGEETLLRPSSWSTTGKKWQDIRSSINRAERAGVRAVWTTYRALPLSMTAQITEISEQWVQEKALPELGFTLGGLDELRDPAVRLMIAVDSAEHVHAVTSWLPTYRDGEIVGWTLDFMRRRPDSINGVMEFLIAQTAQRMQQSAQIEFLSLSIAPLAPAAGPRQGGIADRLLEYLGRTLEPVYGFRSLLLFKRKFQPEFSPVFMAFPDPIALPEIGLALARAYLPSLSMREVVTLMRGLGQ